VHNSCCRSRRTGFTRASPSDPFPVRMTRATHGPRHAPAPRTRLSLAAARWRRVPDSRVRDGSNGDPLARPGCAGPAPGGGHRGEPEDPRVRRATRAAGRSRPQARAGPGAAGGRGGAGRSDMAARGAGVRRASSRPGSPPSGYGSATVRGDNRPLPGAAVRLVGEWRSSGERTSYLSTPRPDTSRRAMADTIAAFRVCGQTHRQPEEDLGLDRCEGRSWTGLHRRALTTGMACACLPHLRLASSDGAGTTTTRLPGPLP